MGMITALISLFLGLRNSTSIHDIEKCRGTSVTIAKPEEGQGVGEHPDVVGTATINDACDFVSVFVESESPTGRVYRCTDSIQVDSRGRWAARAHLDHLAAGQEARIEARLTDGDDPWAPPTQMFGKPPRRGVRSNTIAVVRAQTGQPRTGQ
jgi:hypothetical protein